MTLYYNKNNYEIRELQDSLIQEWIYNNNPKKNNWIILPPKPNENYYWQNGEWVENAEFFKPQSISARQARLWLIRNGISLQNVTDAINSIEDPILRDSIAVEWEYAPYIERNHPMLIPLAQILGLNIVDVDRAFIEGSAL